jgi:hypothetical protein
MRLASSDDRLQYKKSSEGALARLITMALPARLGGGGGSLRCRRTLHASHTRSTRPVYPSASHTRLTTAHCPACPIPAGRCALRRATKCVTASTARSAR